MREIADAANVGLSNIYNYFSGKDALFRAVVQPAAGRLEQLFEEPPGRQGDDIAEKSPATIFRRTAGEYAALLREHRMELEILFFGAQGSSLEDFRRSLAERSAKSTREYLLDMKRGHLQVDTDISDFFIRLHTEWMSTLFEELLTHRTPSGQTERILREYTAFEIGGWRELMNG